jgi:hypothetical protein
MVLYPLYKSTKAMLETLGIQCFFFLRQYETSKENTSYKVPAIYIEMPNYRGVAVQYYGKRSKFVNNLEIKIHYISYAPFKNHTNSIQDTALQQHHNKLIEINNLLEGFRPMNANNELLAEGFWTAETSEMNFMASCIVSVITFKCTAYIRD